MRLMRVSARHAPGFRHVHQHGRLGLSRSTILERAIDQREILGFPAITSLTAAHGFHQSGEI